MADTSSAPRAGEHGNSRAEQRARELKERERQDYNIVAPHYDSQITPLTDRFGLRSIGLLDEQAGQRVLEIAQGPGALIPEHAKRLGPTGQLTCFDQSDAMLELARGRAVKAGMTNAEFIQGDAEVLAGVKDGYYDRVLMVFGMMYLPNPEKALGLIRTKIKPGGRAVVTVWGLPKDVPGLSVPMEAGARVLAPPPFNWFLATGLGRSLLYRQLRVGEKIGGGKTPMCLSPAGLLDGMFQRAGFKNVKRDEHKEVYIYPTPDAYWDVLMGTPARTAIEKFPADKVAVCRKLCADIMKERYGQPDGTIGVPMTAVSVVGDV